MLESQTRTGLGGTLAMARGFHRKRVTYQGIRPSPNPYFRLLENDDVAALRVELLLGILRLHDDASDEPSHSCLWSKSKAC